MPSLLTTAILGILVLVSLYLFMRVKSLEEQIKAHKLSIHGTTDDDDATELWRQLSGDLEPSVLHECDPAGMACVFGSAEPCVNELGIDERVASLADESDASTVELPVATGDGGALGDDDEMPPRFEEVAPESIAALPTEPDAPPPPSPDAPPPPMAVAPPPPVPTAPPPHMPTAPSPDPPVPSAPRAKGRAPKDADVLIVLPSESAAAAPPKEKRRVKRTPPPDA